MTPERLLNMSIEVLYPQTFIPSPPPKKTNFGYAPTTVYIHCRLDREKKDPGDTKTECKRIFLAGQIHRQIGLVAVRVAQAGESTVYRYVYKYSV